MSWPFQGSARKRSGLSTAAMRLLPPRLGPGGRVRLLGPRAAVVLGEQAFKYLAAGCGANGVADAVVLGESFYLVEVVLQFEVLPAVGIAHRGVERDVQSAPVRASPLIPRRRCRRPSSKPWRRGRATGWERGRDYMYPLIQPTFLSSEIHDGFYIVIQEFLTHRTDSPNEFLERKSFKKHRWRIIQCYSANISTVFKHPRKVYIRIENGICRKALRAKYNQFLIVLLAVRNEFENIMFARLGPN